MKTSVIKLGREMFEKDGRNVQKDIKSVSSSFDVLQEQLSIESEKECMTAQNIQAQSRDFIQRYQTFQGSNNLTRPGIRFHGLSLCFCTPLSRCFPYSRNISLCSQRLEEHQI